MISSFSELDQTQTYTYADYLLWQFSERVEILKGYIRKMSAPSSTHQSISGKLHGNLFIHFRHQPCRLFAAPFDVRLVRNKQNADDKEILTVVQPDLCVVCDLTKIDARGCVGAPDFVIEILSPSNSRTELQDKFELYQENGVLEYWLVRPHEKSVQQFVLVNEKYQYVKTYVDDDLISPSIFPDLTIDLKEIFED